MRSAVSQMVLCTFSFIPFFRKIEFAVIYTIYLIHMMSFCAVINPLLGTYMHICGDRNAAITTLWTFNFRLSLVKMLIGCWIVVRHFLDFVIWKHRYSKRFLASQTCILGAVAWAEIWSKCSCYKLHTQKWRKTDIMAFENLNSWIWFTATETNIPCDYIFKISEKTKIKTNQTKNCNGGWESETFPPRIKCQFSPPEKVMHTQTYIVQM